jgi:hypothetical protein
MEIPPSEEVLREHQMRKLRGMFGPKARRISLETRGATVCPWRASRSRPRRR